MVKQWLPEFYEVWIEKHLKPLGFSLQEPKALAQAVLKTSDLYINNPGKATDWSDKDVQAATVSYFFTLNYIRNLKVVEEIKKLDFLRDLTSGIDFGCGPGTFSKALTDNLMSVDEVLGIDLSRDSEKLYLDSPSSEDVEFQFKKQLNKPPFERFFVAMSYAFNELPSVPDWLFDAEAIILVEPSSQKISQNLQNFRGELIEKGYHMWAPCPHQEDCPLNDSPKDWCHDRVYWKQPEWFTTLEKELPIKNESMTFSYLLAHKKKAPTT